MIVKDMRSNRQVRFEEIPDGTVLNLRTGLWIKVEPFVLVREAEGECNFLERPRNLVRLEDGCTARAEDHEMMTPVRLEVEMYDYNSD